MGITKKVVNKKRKDRAIHNTTRKWNGARNEFEQKLNEHLIAWLLENK